MSDLLTPPERAKLDALLDHIYEYGPHAEGITNLAIQLCQTARESLIEKNRDQQYRDFILRARRESQLVEINGEFKIVIPYWFMKDNGIEVYDG